jgi:hypothetical protein
MVVMLMRRGWHFANQRVAREMPVMIGDVPPSADFRAECFGLRRWHHPAPFNSANDIVKHTSMEG